MLFIIVLELGRLIKYCFIWLDTHCLVCVARLGKRDICVLVRVGWTAEWSDRVQESSVPERGSTRTIYFNSVLVIV